MTKAEPLHFQPVYQTYLWGGRTMVKHYQREDAPADGPVAESWELSDRADGMSVTAEGHSLRELIAKDPAAILGTATAAASGAFPLLIKVLAARETLSVQVHPDDETAAAGHGEAKSEAWYVLAAAPDACVYHGFKAEVARAEAEASLTDGSIEEKLDKIPVRAGDIIYVPGGTVHAIGAGCLLLEVQQNSNTTFRIFDWNRTGADGKPRELHLEQSRQVIHWERLEGGVPVSRGDCQTPYFAILPREITSMSLSAVDPAGGFTVVFVEAGPVQLKTGGDTQSLPAGTTWLLPAAVRDAELQAADDTPAKVVLIRGRQAA
jgi:mannose-6-phosphate isomerase